MRNYEDEIIELNFDTEDEDAQKRAIELKKLLLRRSSIFRILAVIIFLLSLAAFITLVAFGFKGYGETILYSIIPLITMVGSTYVFFLGTHYKALAEEIIIEAKEQ